MHLLLAVGLCLAQMGGLFKEVISLRLAKVFVPRYELYGGIALLECQYELNNSDNKHQPARHNSSEGGRRDGPKPTQQQQKQYHYTIDSNEHNDEGETLYSVKWYKDNEEFYRYVPRAHPPQHSYKVDGVRVDHDYSNNVRVKLKRLSLKSSGLYRCEVSAEAPNFSSDHGEGRMDVIYLPRDNPQITGEERLYQVGDVLPLNCTSSKSHPAPLVQWLINDEPARPAALRHYNEIQHTHGLVTVVLGLQLQLEGRHFHDGTVRVRCVASVSPELWQGGKNSILHRRPSAQYEDREAMRLVRSGSWRLAATSSWSTAMLLALGVLCQLVLCAPLCGVRSLKARPSRQRSW